MRHEIFFAWNEEEFMEWVKRYGDGIIMVLHEEILKKIGFG